MTTQTSRNVRRAKRTSYVSYALLAVAILFAILAWWLEERGAGSNAAASGFAVSLGLFMLCRAGSGLQSGLIKVRRTTADRTERPTVFWTVAAVFTVIGIILTAGGMMNFFGLL